jgi:pimeloyl-ACP methyl ester carboxylesterase
VLPSGLPVGAPEEALDRACGLSLDDPQRLAGPPPAGQPVTGEDRTEVMTLSHREAWIDRTSHRIYARDHPGQEPAIVLLSGIPDNLHLDDRLDPSLNPPRRVVTFDVLGWGDSDKPANYPCTATNQTGDLDAVTGQLGLDQVTVVVHDASGPPGIDGALEHPDRVAGWILLNTSCCLMPTLRPPEVIALYPTPRLRTLVPGLARASDRFDRGPSTWQVGRFISHAPTSQELVPRLDQGVGAARPAFWALNNDLLGTVIARTRRIPELPRFDRPVRSILGARDPSLNKGVARRFHQLVPAARLFLVPGARHYVQVDKPRPLANLMVAEAATTSPARSSNDRQGQPSRPESNTAAPGRGGRPMGAPTRHEVPQARTKSTSLLGRVPWSGGNEGVVVMLSDGAGAGR